MKFVTLLSVMALLCHICFGQNTTAPTISGTVRNEAGEPLANASISMLPSGRGALTNAKGLFTLSPVNLNDQLRISLVGYAPQTVTITGTAPLNITLKLAINELDRVVVQAYGTTSQRLATGNIGVVRGDEIARQPVMNPLEALQGKVAGVVVTSTSGYANGPVKIEIRGRNAINDKFSADPLYIIDGVPLTILDLNQRDSYKGGAQGAIQSGVPSPANGQSPFFNINPQDIESVEILKDADATALYGSRGANGVILITTKKGKQGKTEVELKLTGGFNQIPRFNDMLHTQQYLMLRREALANDGIAPTINNAADLIVWDTSRYTDWQRYLWGGRGKNTDVQLSISGGSAQTSFRIGANYRYQADLITQSGSYQRGGITTGINHRSVNNRFNVSLNSLFSKTVSDMKFLPTIITAPPHAPDVFDKEGYLNFRGWEPLSNLFNFGGLLKQYESRSFFLNNGLALSYQLMPGVTARANVGYGLGFTDQISQTPILSQDPQRNPTGQASLGKSFFENLIIEPQLEYMAVLGGGKLTALLGGSWQHNKTAGSFLLGNGFTRDANLENIGTSPQLIGSNNENQYKYLAAFTRINYAYKNRYIFNFNLRRDGSSRFGPGHRFGNFGSIGGAWIWADESWVQKHLPFVSFGKLRGSYGLTGSDPAYDYQFLSKWSFIAALYNRVQPLVPGNHTDSLLHWQVNRKGELALDLGFFKDRLSLSLAWYSNQCNDQIIPFPTPALTGFPDVISNSPANVRNTGWELLLSGSLLQRQKLHWSSRINIGINRNKLLSYPNIAQSPYAGTLVVGQSLNILKLLHSTGVDPQTGLYTYKDINGDGKITLDFTGKTADDRLLYDLSTRFDAGFTNDISWGNWKLNVFVYLRRQLIENPLRALSGLSGIFNYTTDMLNRWQQPGDRATFARLTTNPGRDNSYLNFSRSDRVYTDALYMRLQNLSLSYTPAAGIFARQLKGSSIFIQGQNLFLITNYKGLDPEVPGFGAMPRARTLTAGITITL